MHCVKKCALLLKKIGRDKRKHHGVRKIYEKRFAITPMARNKSEQIAPHLTAVSPFFMNIIKLLTRGEIWISANFLDPIHGAMVAHAM